MSPPRRPIVAALMLMGLLLVACDGSSTSGAGSIPAQYICDYDFTRLMLTGWTLISKTSLEAPDDKGGPLCVVLYHFDRPRDGRKTVPVGGMVYRADRNRPLDFHSHPLSLPGGLCLGEHQVSAYLADVLSGHEGSELVVQDKTEDDIIAVQASIFEWQEFEKSEESSFKSRGWFIGDGGVIVDKDKVTVLKRRGLPWLRSQIADRFTYLPRENKSYYPKQGDKPEDTSRLVDPATVDLVTLVMPANPTTSEFPEKLVLAFYETLPLTDVTKLDGWIGSEMPLHW